MAKAKNTNPIPSAPQQRRQNLKSNHDVLHHEDALQLISPLVPPFSIHPAIKHLGWVAAERGNSVTCGLRKPTSYHKVQSVLSGKRYQEEAEIELEAWPNALDSLRAFYGKPFTREMAMQIMGPAMAAGIMAATEIGGDRYLGDDDSEDED